MNDKRGHSGRRWVAILCCVAVMLLSGFAIAQNTIVQDRSSDEITIAFRHLRDEYIINTYTENGEITPHGSVRVPAGTNQTFMFTPNAGYQLQRVLVDGNVVWNRATATTEPPTGYAFRRVLADHTLEVSFVRIPATATPTPTATTRPTTTTTASPTATVTVTPTPTRTSSGGGGGGGGGTTIIRTTAPATSPSAPTLPPGVTSPPATGGGGAVTDPTLAPEYVIPDEDVPQSGIGANSVGDCFE